MTIVLTWWGGGIELRWVLIKELGQLQIANATPM